MHVLQEFVFKRVIPQFKELERAQAGEDLALKRTAYAEVFESFLWLHLGSELRVFNRSVTASVYESFYAPFFNSLNSQSSEALEQSQDMFRSRLYVYDTAESRELKAVFPDFVILIEKAMRRDPVFDTQLNDFSRPEMLRPLFTALLLIYARITADSSVRILAWALQFLDQNAWERLWNSGQCDAEDVLWAAESDESSESEKRLPIPSPAHLYAGFLRLWKYTSHLREHFDNWDDDRRIESADRFKLMARIKAIQRWRLNLTSVQASQRFDQIRNALKRNLDAEGDRSIELLPVIVEINKSFDQVFEFYLSFAVRSA